MKHLSLSGPACMLSRVRLRAIAWTVAHQAPLSMGSSRQEYWSGLPFLPPGDLAEPGIQPAFLESFCIGRQTFFFNTAPPVKHRLQSASSRFQGECRRLLPWLFTPWCCLSEVKCGCAPRSQGTSRVSAHSGRPSPCHCSMPPGVTWLLCTWASTAVGEPSPFLAPWRTHWLLLLWWAPSNLVRVYLLWLPAVGSLCFIRFRLKSQKLLLETAGPLCAREGTGKCLMRLPSAAPMQWVKRPSATQETQVQSLGQERGNPLQYSCLKVPQCSPGGREELDTIERLSTSMNTRVWRHLAHIWDWVKSPLVLIITPSGSKVNISSHFCLHLQERTPKKKKKTNLLWSQNLRQKQWLKICLSSERLFGERAWGTLGKGRGREEQMPRPGFSRRALPGP